MGIRVHRLECRYKYIYLNYYSDETSSVQGAALETCQGLLAQIELQAVASSGLPITYTINNDNIAEVYTAGSKTYLDCFGTGDVQILAIQEGNQNYYSSPRVRKIVHIDDDDAISTLDESNVKIQGTSFGATITGAKKGETVRVYTIDGKLRHSVEVDSQSLDIPLEKGGIYIIQVGTKTVKLGH